MEPERHRHFVVALVSRTFAFFIVWALFAVSIGFVAISVGWIELFEPASFREAVIGLVSLAVTIVIFAMGIRSLGRRKLAQVRK